MTPLEGQTDARSLGWLASFALHGALLFGTLILTQRITLAPQPPAFTWRVAMVGEPSDSTPPTSSATTPIHEALPTSRRNAPLVRPLHPPASIRSTRTAPAAAPRTDSPRPQRNETYSPALSNDESSTPQPPAPASPPSAVEQPEPGTDSDVGSAQREVPPTAESGSPAETLTPAFVATSIPRPDYAWLSETILRRMEELKRYPADARLDRLEGKVVLKAIVKSDGNVEAVEVFRSSGHDSLDRAAVDLLHLAAPFRFPHSLGKPQMTVKIPMTYTLAP